MSQKIRIGNDIDIRWSLLDADEHPYIVEGRDISIELNVGKKRVRITEVETSGNTVHFIYRGKDQRYTGGYILKFIENDGVNDMVTFDTDDVFELVEHSWEAVDEGEVPETIQLEVVTVTSILNEKVGPKGDAATIEVGSTVTGEPGTQADVSNSGDKHHAVLNFVIPRGDRGYTGDCIYPVFGVTENMHLVSEEGVDRMSINGSGHLLVDY